eukprot:7619746-Alexandrium_andersonii.AAC.1
MRSSGAAAKLVQRQVALLHELGQIAEPGQRSAASAPSASSQAGLDRVDALFAGTEPQPTEGGSQKRKASLSQPGLLPPSERTGSPPLQQPASSAQGAVAKGSQLGPGDPTPRPGKHHAFPIVRPGIPRATQHVPGLDPAHAPRLTLA